jgi:hypothetical protein
MGSQKPAALQQEAREMLDKALATTGSERAMYLALAIRIHREARNAEAEATLPDRSSSLPLRR